MVFLKPTKFEDIWRLVLDSGDTELDMYEVLEKLTVNGYQVVTQWEVYDDKHDEYLDDFLGFSTIQREISPQIFSNAIIESRTKGFRLGRYDLTPVLKDIEVKIYDLLTDKSDLPVDIREVPI